MADDESIASMEAIEDTKDIKGDADMRQDRIRKLPPAKVRAVDAGEPGGMEKLCGGGPEARVTPAASPRRSGDPAGDGSDADEDEDEEYDDEEDDTSVHTEMEGCTDWDVGWMWVEPCFPLAFYEEMQAGSRWNLTYKRPPKVYPWD